MAPANVLLVGAGWLLGARSPTEGLAAGAIIATGVAWIAGRLAHETETQLAASPHLDDSLLGPCRNERLTSREARVLIAAIAELDREIARGDDWQSSNGRALLTMSRVLWNARQTIVDGRLTIPLGAGDPHCTGQPTLGYPLGPRGHVLPGGYRGGGLLAVRERLYPEGSSTRQSPLALIVEDVVRWTDPTTQKKSYRSVLIAMLRVSGADAPDADPTMPLYVESPMPVVVRNMLFLAGACYVNNAGLGAVEARGPAQTPIDVFGRTVPGIATWSFDSDDTLTTRVDAP